MAAVKTYQKGSKPRLRVTFTDPDTGSPFDPQSIVLKIQNPELAVVTRTFGGGDADFVRTDLGKYEAHVDLNLVGSWKWTFNGTTGPDTTVVFGQLLCEDKAGF